MPPALNGTEPEQTDDFLDQDIDAEGEEDIEEPRYSEQIGELGEIPHDSDDENIKEQGGSEGQDESIVGMDGIVFENGEEQKPEVEPDDTGSDSGSGNGDTDESETEAVGAVKINPDAEEASADGGSEDEDNVSNERSVVGKDDDDQARSSEASAADSECSDSEAEEFEASGSNEDEDEKPADEQNNCIFCKQGEEDDPSEDFEPYLSCLVCGEHSHPQCARENNALGQDIDTERWLCPVCSATERTPEFPEGKSSRPRSSAPRLVRDLLPVTRGVQKKNSHSIFAQPLISEGEDMDGSRKLRKRKSPTHEPPGSAEKRRRKATPRTLSDATSNKQQDEEETDEVMASPVKAPFRSTRRASQKNVPPVRVIQHRPLNKPPAKYILAFHLEQSKIAEILSKRPKPKRVRDRRRPPKIQPPVVPVFHSPPHKFPALPTNNLIFPSILHEREQEINAKPYGGILPETDADTSRTLPGPKDREIFEAARKEAEEERRKSSLAAEIELTNPDSANNPPTTARSNRTVSGPPSKIKCIQFGRFIIDTFYAAPYPEEYSHESRLFICEFCLKYLPSEPVAYRHKLKCPAKHPPGDEIYRDGSISIWEVDGRKKTEYCQCLCLMAKMFLGSKTLYYDVEPFLFYILTENDDLGYHFVGYFSKEKRPQSLNNVSCILVMPIHQRKGYATFLIDFSYLLTRIEGKEGSPEKPLSDMGLTAYRSYWDLTISRHLLALLNTSPSSSFPAISARTLMSRTGMTADDVIHSLERLYAFVRDPITKTYAIRYDRKLYEQIVSHNEAKGYRQLKPEKLVWTPYVMGRSDHAQLDGAQMHTLAAREGTAEGDGDGMQVKEETNADVRMKDGEVEDQNGVRSGHDDTKESPRRRNVNAKDKCHGRLQSEDASERPTMNGAPTNELGRTAPGPPPTAALSTAISTEVTQSNTNGVNGTTEPDMSHSCNGVDPDAASSSAVAQPTSEKAVDETLSGYALAYRTHKIPPSRFEIDPPIPSAMLALARGRSKKRAFGSAFGDSARRQSNTAANLNGTADGSITPTMGLMNPPVPVRSSPRHSSQVNGHGNLNGGKSGVVTPAPRPGRMRASGTPVRRSVRAREGNRLVDLGMDGVCDDEEEDEEGGNAEGRDDDNSDSRSASGNSSDESEDDQKASDVEADANGSGDDDGDEDANDDEDADGSVVDD